MTTRTKSLYTVTAVGVYWLRSRCPYPAQARRFQLLCWIVAGVFCWLLPVQAQPQGVPSRPTVVLVGAEKEVPKKLPPITAAPSIDSLLRLAYQEEQAKHPWQSINAFRKALELEPRNRVVLVSYARMKHRSGDVEGAKILYKQVLQYYPQDPTTLNDLALCYARKGQYPEALQYLQAAVDASPKNKRYRNNLATLLVESGQPQPAYDLLAQTFGAPIAHYNLGWLLQRQGKTEEAVSHLQQALQLDPSLSPAVQLLDEIQRNDIGKLQSGTSLAVTQGPSGALWNPSTGPMFKIAPQSATEEVDSPPAVKSAVYHEVLDGGDEPPNVDDFPIAGLNEFLESGEMDE